MPPTRVLIRGAQERARPAGHIRNPQRRDRLRVRPVRRRNAVSSQRRQQLRRRGQRVVRRDLLAIIKQLGEQLPREVDPVPKPARLHLLRHARDLRYRKRRLPHRNPRVQRRLRRLKHRPIVHRQDAPPSLLDLRRQQQRRLPNRHARSKIRRHRPQPSRLHRRRILRQQRLQAERRQPDAARQAQRLRVAMLPQQPPYVVKRRPRQPAPPHHLRKTLDPRGHAVRHPRNQLRRRSRVFAQARKVVQRPSDVPLQRPTRNLVALGQQIPLPLPVGRPRRRQHDERELDRLQVALQPLVRPVHDAPRRADRYRRPDLPAPLDRLAEPSPRVRNRRRSPLRLDGDRRRARRDDENVGRLRARVLQHVRAFVDHGVRIAPRGALASQRPPKRAV